jgi:hypothetical protein
MCVELIMMMATVHYYCCYCYHISARYVRDVSVFDVCCSIKNYPPVRCASAANVICRDVDIFGTKTVSLNHIL